MANEFKARFYSGIGARGPQGPKGDKGNTGATGPRGPVGYHYTPNVSTNGDLTWTNNGGLENPDPVNLTDKFVNEVEAARSSVEGLEADLASMRADAEDLSGVIAQAQEAVNGIEAQRDEIMRSIADAAELGTDTTLSTPGMAADAKAAGDSIGDLRRAFERPLLATSWNETFEKGAIKTSTGQPVSHNGRIRTRGFISTGVQMCIELPDNLQILVFKYAQENDDSYIGVEIDGWLSGKIYLSSDKYYKIVAKYVDEADIPVSEGDNISFSRLDLDESLTSSGAIPDSKSVGDAINQVEGNANARFEVMSNVLSEEIAEDIAFSQGAIRTTNGANWRSSKRIRSNYYDVAFGFNFTVPQGFRALLLYYAKEAYTTYIGVDPEWRTGEVNVEAPNGRYLRIALGRSDDTDLTPSDVGTIVIRRRVLAYRTDIAAKSFASNSWGIANIIANSKHIAEVKWTPVASMPKTVNNDSPTLDTVQYFPMVEQTGIPYSSVRDQDKAVGMDVSIHTFMTAARDPNSVLYKRLSTVSNSAPYYGAVCSGLINYSTGICLDLTNGYLAESDMFETIPMTSIMPGDMIWIDGHCALVYEVEKDDFGRISSVTIREEWRPVPRTTKYLTWESYTTARDGYIARRFLANAEVPYTPIPYVQCFDEVPEDIVYPDVQTDHGDAAVFKVGEDVKVNVIDDPGFSTITVKRGDTAVYTSSSITSFTLENVQAGLHTITASGTGEDSVSTFFVVDCSAEFDDTTGELTFESSNATPVMVGVYKVPANRKVGVRDIILTEEEKAAGKINVLSYMDEEFKFAKVWFSTPYGTAVWYSENHAKWIDIP